MISSWFKTAFADYKWLPLLLIAAIMTNTGYGSNLLLALRCEQYYLEYLLFFVMVFGAKTLSDRFSVPTGTKSLALTTAVSGLLISALFFIILLAYNWITNCPFDPVAFVTTRMPLILIFTGTYEYWKYRNREPEPYGIDQPIVLNRLDGARVPMCKAEIGHASIAAGVLKVTTHSGEEFTLDGTLKALCDQLNDPQNFYRVNRSDLVHRKSIRCYKVNARHQLEVILHNDTLVLVNKNRTRAFKQWLGSFPS